MFAIIRSGVECGDSLILEGQRFWKRDKEAKVLGCKKLDNRQRDNSQRDNRH